MTVQSWTRATTIASTLEDRYGLERWAKRNVVLGIAARPDLYALAASAKPEDKDLLHSIIDDAEEAAKARSGANLGKALHKITARIDTGEELDVPIAWRPDVDAYCQTLADSAVKIHPEYVERVVLALNVKVAGTLDRIVTYNGTSYVADLKTGVDALNYGATDIAVQLAVYANASHMWTGTAEEADANRDRWKRYRLPNPTVRPEEYEPMPNVSKSKALVIHLPLGEAKCSLHWIDIEAGAQAIEQALWARKWRNRRDLLTPLNPEPFELGIGKVSMAQAIEDEQASAEFGQVISIGGVAADDDW